MERFDIQTNEKIDDGIGGMKSNWKRFATVYGYIDLLTGTDLNINENAFIEQSTHILIVPTYKKGITDEMRIVDKDKRIYGITYSDNPVGANHHNELYCKYDGVI